MDLTGYFAESDEKYNEFNAGLTRIGKEKLIPTFSIFQLHLSELACIKDTYLIPEISDIINTDGSSIMSPIKGAISVAPFNYRFILQLQVLTKAFFFILRICLDDLLKILNNLYVFLRKEHNGRSPPKDFGSFVDYVLNDGHRNLDDRIVSLLDQFLTEFVIIRFIRNRLKGEGIFLFDLRYCDYKFFIYVRFESDINDDMGIKKLVEVGLIKIENNLIFFDLERLAQSGFYSISKIKDTIVDIILEDGSGESMVECNSETSPSDGGKDNLIGLIGVDTTEKRGMPSKLDLNHGTITSVLKIDDSSISDTGSFDIHSYTEENGRLLIKIENRTEFVIFHELNGIRTIVNVDYSKYLNQYTHVAVTWDTDEKKICLFLNGKKNTEQQIYT